jgi:hypothetical protein
MLGFKGKKIEHSELTSSLVPFSAHLVSFSLEASGQTLMYYSQLSPDICRAHSKVPNHLYSWNMAAAVCGAVNKCVWKKTVTLNLPLSLSWYLFLREQISRLGRWSWWNQAMWILGVLLSWTGLSYNSFCITTPYNSLLEIIQEGEFSFLKHIKLVLAIGSLL